MRSIVVFLLVIITALIARAELAAQHIESLEYPVVALQAGVSGVAVLSCNIREDGTVESVEPVSGPPLLVEAAIANVRRWRFTRYVGAAQSVTLRYKFEISGASAAVRSPFVFECPDQIVVTAQRPPVMFTSSK